MELIRVKKTDYFTTSVSGTDRECYLSKHGNVFGILEVPAEASAAILHVSGIIPRSIV